MGQISSKATRTCEKRAPSISVDLAQVASDCTTVRLVLLVLGYPFYVGPLRDEAVLGYEILAFVMFEGLLVVFGMAVAVVAGRLETYLPAMARNRFSTALSVGTLAVPCSVEALIVALMILNPFE